MQKRANLIWRAIASTILVVACSTLAMHNLTVEIIGVSSQRSGDVLVRAGAQGGAGNGLRFICTEAWRRMGRLRTGPGDN